MLKKSILKQLYLKDKESVSFIATKYECSQNKVNYWLQKYGIPKRSISEAVYLKVNPKGDPFKLRRPVKDKEWFLYGMGLGLYWGEGNKMNNHAVRLGNTDPDLLRTFLEFLAVFFSVDVTRLHFGLQIFTDIDSKVAKDYWCKKLSLRSEQFQKIIVSKSLHKRGTYRKKSQYGVLTIYFSNTKLRDIIVGAIEELREKVPM
jgi:hypothetical protein